MCYWSQEYIGSSERTAHLEQNDGGFWRGLIVRSGTKDLTATVLIRSDELSREEMETEKSKLGIFFGEGRGREAKLTSLYVQKFPVDLGGGRKSEPELIFGPGRIAVDLFGHQFHVGPNTYFPGNLPTEEKILKLLRSHINVNHVVEKSSNFVSSKKSKNVSLFVVGCGAGTYSILFSNNVRNCVSFDISVSDAKHNASIFGLTGDKCEFVAGNYVKTVPKYFRNLENEASLGIVILNPGRLGIDRLLISQIRGCSLIKKVIYISSNPEGDSFHCFRDLCREVTKETKKNRFSLIPISQQFWLQFSVPVDSSPHTPHCQHIFVFTRK